MKYECMGCHKVMDGFLDITPGENKADLPVQGAFTICISCGIICVFDEKMEAQPATALQLIQMREADYRTYMTLMQASALIRRRIKQN